MVEASDLRAESWGPPCLLSPQWDGEGEAVVSGRLVRDNEMKRMVREELEGIAPSSWEPLLGTTARSERVPGATPSHSGSPV